MAPDPLAAHYARPVRPEVRAWDIPTRLFHWLLVALVVSAYVTRFALDDPTLYWHRMNGYTLLVLLIFRLLWGVVGSSTSRISTLFRWPLVGLRYGWDLLRGRPRHFLGHNPAGSWLIIVLFGMVAAQAGTGLFTTDEVLVEGPLVRFASQEVVDRASVLHGRIYYVLLGMIGLHILANFVYQFVKRDRLITAMVTGSKPALPYEDEREARIAPLWRAAACLLVAIAIVAGGVTLAGGSLLE